jgi:hypothetical protein
VAAILAAGSALAGIIGGGGLTGFYERLIHHSPATLSATITGATVQQATPFSDWYYLHGGKGRGPDLSPRQVWPKGSTLGVQVSLQVRLSGSTSDLYSAAITLVNPQTTQEITDLDSNWTWCDNKVPPASNTGFVLVCWIGQPLSDPSFAVHAEFYDAGDQTYYDAGYKGIPDVNPLAIWTSRSFKAVPYTGPVHLVFPIRG